MAKQPTQLAVQQPLLEPDGTATQHFRTWLNEVSAYVPIVGSGTPEGVVEARQYAQYIDESDPNYPVRYIKMYADINGDRKRGWISALAMDALFVDGDLDVTGDAGIDGTAQVDGKITSDSLTVTGNDSITLSGDATSWDDIQTSLIGRRLNSTSGTVDYDYAENAIVFSSGGSITNTNDTVIWSIQTSHATRLDSTLKLHMHYEQEDSTNRTFTVRYRLQDNGSAKETSWTTVTADTDDSAFPYVSGTLINILPIAAIDLSGYGISTIVQLQMTRTDAQSGTVKVLFVDAHFERDGFGSGLEYVK